MKKQELKQQNFKNSSEKNIFKLRKKEQRKLKELRNNKQKMRQSTRDSKKKEINNYIWT